MSLSICCVPCSPLRAEASHRAEMVSQLLFGERAEMLEQTADHWVKIKCVYDGYEGWCQDSHLISMDEKPSEQSALVPAWAAAIDYNGTTMHIPLGSSLDGMKKGKLAWNKIKIIYTGKLIRPGHAPFDQKAMEKIARLFLNTPYLWGGRSVFGVDCSGFTQTVFRFMNIRLLRDAWQQATQGAPVESIEKTRPGDLAFFDNAQGRITHVGILFGKNKIIHASGKLRIDKMSADGIIHADTKEMTHRLNQIRRYF